ncbi:MAG: pirin-like C-terminal cupin domain-containing protein [Promethearchaeota archaeon]
MNSTRTIPAGNVVKYSDDGEIQIRTQNSPARFLFMSGKPLHEPVAWRGLIVMNTQEELDKAFWEVQNKQFIKS